MSVGTPPAIARVTRPSRATPAKRNCSITGGMSTRALAVTGWHVPHVDFCSGRMWLARQNEGQWASKLLAPTVFFVQSFGEDVAGELYLVTSGGDLLRVRE